MEKKTKKRNGKTTAALASMKAGKNDSQKVAYVLHTVAAKGFETLPLLLLGVSFVSGVGIVLAYFVKEPGTMLRLMRSVENVYTYGFLFLVLFAVLEAVAGALITWNEDTEEDRTPRSEAANTDK